MLRFIWLTGLLIQCVVAPTMAHLLCINLPLIIMETFVCRVNVLDATSLQELATFESPYTLLAAFHSLGCSQADESRAQREEDVFNKPSAKQDNRKGTDDFRHISNQLVPSILKEDDHVGFTKQLSSQDGAILLLAKGWSGRQRSLGFILTLAHGEKLNAFGWQLYH